MLHIIAAFVETPYYVVAAALVIFVGVFWFALNHDKTLLLPYIGSTVFVIALSTLFGVSRIFLISPPSFMVGLTIHLLVVAWLSHPVRRLILRRLVGSAAGTKGASVPAVSKSRDRA